MIEVNTGYGDIKYIPECDTSFRLDARISSLVRMQVNPTRYSLQELQTAEDVSMQEIHHYCDELGVGYDIDGWQQRVEFAEAIDRYIIQEVGLNDDDESAANSKTKPRRVQNNEFLRSITDEDLQRLVDNSRTKPITSRINKGMFGVDSSSNNETANVIQPEVRTSYKSLLFNPIRAVKTGVANLRSHINDKGLLKRQVSDKSEAVHVRKNKKFIIGGIATLAVLASGIFYTRNLADDNKEVKSSLNPVTTSTSELPATVNLPVVSTVPSTTENRPTTSKLNYNNLDDSSTSTSTPTTTIPPNIDIQPPAEIGTAISAEALTIENGGNTWDALEQFATGSTKADNNKRLQQVIVELLPKIAQQSNIKDLGKINSGARVILTQEDAQKLREAGTASIG